MSHRSVSSCLALLIGCAGTALAEPTPTGGDPVAAATPVDSIGARLAEEVRSVFEKHQNAVVKVRAHDDQGELSGTGFFIDANGTVLTSYSVGGTSRDITVQSAAGTTYTTERLLGDCRSGIALLKVLPPVDASSPLQTPFIKLGDSASLTIATPVITVAYPLDLPITPNFGIIAGFHIRHLDRYFATTHIRANVPVQRGESGAPLLNLQGEAVGMVTSGTDGGASCFAVPSDAVAKVYDDFRRFGDMRPGWLGMKVNHRAFNEGRESDTRVTEVIGDSPAAKAGMRVGDVLVRIGKHPVEKPEDVINACFFLTPGDATTITVSREGATVVLELDPSERRPGTEEKEAKRAERFNTRELTDDIILRTDED